MLIKHCIKIFMDNKKLMNVSPLTLKKYGFYFNDLREYCFEREVVSIDGLTAPFMRGYILYRIEDLNNKESTVNSMIRFCKSFFNNLIEEEIMDKNL